MKRWIWLLISVLGVGFNRVLPANFGSDAAPVLPIGSVQGAARESPYLDREVTLRGVVTGFYEDQNEAGIVYYTAFLQDLPGREDGLAETSDAIALFLGRRRPSFQLGDQVRVTGRVTEFYGLTELDDAGLEVVVEGEAVPLPRAVTVSLPAAGDGLVAHFEHLESMRVRLPRPMLVVGPTFSGCGLAVMDAQSVSERPLRRHAAEGSSHVLPILHHSDVDCTDFPVVKAGDLINGLTGPLTYHFDQYKVVVQQPIKLAVAATSLVPPPPPPQVSASEITVATINLENYFDAVDDTGSDGEPKLSPAALEVKQAKLVYALAITLGCPTLIGVQEVEKAPLLQALAERAAASCGFVYEVIHRESVDVRGIDVALLSDPRRVKVESAVLRQGCTNLNTGITDDAAACAAPQQPLFSRPPLQVTVEVDGRAYTLFVNHFKSKRGGEAETAARRLAQARHQVALVDALLERDPQARIVVMGDLNDYEESPAVQHLSQRLTNVLVRVPAAARYTFVYGGVAQLLDGIFISPALAESVAAVQIFHVNADYPDAWGRKIDAATMAYRATDHDLPLVVLREAGVESAIADVPASPVNSFAPHREPEQPVVMPNSAPAIWPFLIAAGGVGLVMVLLGWGGWRRWRK